MLVKSERERLRKVVAEAVLLLCKNSCIADSLQLSIEGLIGITFGEEEVILVSFKEEAKSCKSVQNVPERRTATSRTSNVEKAVAAQTCEESSIAKKSTEDVSVTSVTSVTVTPSSEDFVGSVSDEEDTQNSRSSLPGKRKQIDSVTDHNKTDKTLLENDIVVNKRLCLETSGSDRELGKTADVDCDISHVKSEIQADRVASGIERHSQSARPTVEQSTSLSLENGTSSGEAKNSETSNGHQSVTTCDNTPQNAIQLASEKDHAESRNPSCSNFFVKCEDDSIDDDDCVFVKSEIFELTDANVLEFSHDEISQGVTADIRLTEGDAFFGEVSSPYSQQDTNHYQRLQADIQTVGQLSDRKSRYVGYMQRGCITQASSASRLVQSLEDPNAYMLASGRNDGPLECHICKTVLKSRQTLNDHIQGTHLSRYRYKCSLCGLGFKWRSMLSYHKKSCLAVPEAGFR